MSKLWAIWLIILGFSLAYVTGNLFTVLAAILYASVFSFVAVLGILCLTSIVIGISIYFDWMKEKGRHENGTQV